MIKLKNLISELTVPTNKGLALFTAIPGKVGIIFIAKTSKDLDKLEGMSESKITKSIQKYLDRKFNIKFRINRAYQGAGFYFEIDLFDIVKQVN